jgi:2-oxoglutarate ferredoxin oxidoreductase subunit alpha
VQARDIISDPTHAPARIRVPLASACLEEGTQGSSVMATDASTASGPAQQSLPSVAIRFCGDSGDGMQFAGTEFTNTTAIFGNDVATFPDYPAEIRAPQGTTYGVSGFQIQFGSDAIYTPGDKVNVLIAMNPAGLKTNLGEVESGGVIIVNEDAFTAGNLKKAGYDANPLDDGSLDSYKLYKVPITRLTEECLANSGMNAKSIGRAKNMFALGIVYWLFDRPMDHTINWLTQTFAEKKKKPEIADINIKALKAGYYLGETAELFSVRYNVAPAAHPPGTYRRVSGNGAIGLGLTTAACKASKQLLYASYPITPASDIIHHLSLLKNYGVKTFQAEDELAAVCAAIGASFAGDIGVTGTSGPGLALKSEALGLAVMMELPLVVVDVQRAGPATGMPTKTEQADLLQAMWGRPGESPCIILAAKSPSDCFHTAIEAVRLAVRHMCPVIILSDAYIANGAEPWLIPDVDAIEPIVITHRTETNNPDGQYNAYERDAKTLARPWVLPGTPGLEHRIGGLEKEDLTGNVSYDADNHDAMVRLRAEKVNRAADSFAPLEVRGPDEGDVLLLGWGGTYGVITTVGDSLRKLGHSVSTLHLRHLNPLPNDIGDVMRRFKLVILPEVNTGQLIMLLRSRYLMDIKGVNEVRGRMFAVEELMMKVMQLMDDAGIDVHAEAATEGATS